MRYENEDEFQKVNVFGKGQDNVGAKKDSWFSHISVEVPGEETANEWCEPVTDEAYGSLE